MSEEEIVKILQDDKHPQDVHKAIAVYKHILLSLALKNGGELFIPITETDTPYTLMYRLEIIESVPHYRIRVVPDKTFQ